MGFEIKRFQGDVDEELICPICSGVLEDPLQVCVVFYSAFSGGVCALFCWYLNVFVYVGPCLRARVLSCLYNGVDKSPAHLPCGSPSRHRQSAPTCSQNTTQLTVKVIISQACHGFLLVCRSHIKIVLQGLI